MDLMFENCKEYNRPDSRLYKDGVKLQRIAVSVNYIQSTFLFFQDEAVTVGKPAVQIDYRTESAALKIQYFVRRWLYRKDMGKSGQLTRSLLQHKITESRYCNAI